MKKISVILVLVFTIMIFSSSVIAQKSNYRVIGIGVNVLDFSGLLSGYGSTVYIPINVAPVFRLEPFLGFNTRTEEYDDEPEESESYMQLGIGIMPTIRRGNAVIYIGGRIGFAFGSDEDKDFNGDVYAEDSYFTFGLGPILGGEYYFNPHLSLGGEMAIMYNTATDKRDYTDPLNDDIENKFSGIGTESLIFIRFYF